MFHSIFHRLQIYYGLLLLGAFVAFGMTNYHLERSKVMQGLDDLLVSRTIRLNNALLRFEQDGKLLGDESNIQGIPLLDRSEEVTGRYYYVWSLSEDKTLLLRSDKAPLGIAVPTGDGFIKPGGITRIRGNIRERISHSRFSYAILVGIDMSEDLKGLRSYLWKMISIGCGLFITVLLISYWISKRALKPIDDISEAAHRIAKGNLDERIETANSRSELGKLSGVLNETFDKLEEGYRRQTQFTSDVSHELRTPIAIILSEVQSGADTIVEYQEGFEVCENAARSMRDLVEELLHLARFDAGTHTEEMKMTDLAPLVKQCIDLLAPIAAQKEINLTTELASVSCRVEPGRISQVVTNLLANAISYTEPEGVIAIKLLQPAGVAKIEIKDTGIGISATDLPRVFERFYRVDPARTGCGAQSGLGLAIAKEIATAHGGAISVQSIEGEGSTFTVEIPA